MEAILQSLGLSTLLERFVEEKIEPETVLSLSENALIRLGVTAYVSLICVVLQKTELLELHRVQVLQHQRDSK